MSGVIIIIKEVLRLMWLPGLALPHPLLYQALDDFKNTFCLALVSIVKTLQLCGCN